MRPLFLLFLSLLVATPAALAKPVTLTEARKEFAMRGTDVPQVAYLDGHPVLSGEMLGQGFEAVLYECEGAEKACEAIRYTSCHEMPDFSRIEALEVANTYNQTYKRGTAYAEEKWFGQVVCMKLQQRLGQDDVFGLNQIFEWQVELEDFLQAMEDATTDKLAANVLDNTAQ